MKSHRVFVGLCVLLLAICAVVAVPAIWDHLHTLYPTPETESAFLKNYTPERVIEPFEDRSTSQTKGSTGAAGHEFVSHTNRFGWYFAIASKKWMPLMNALRDDASAQLVSNGARILSQSGNPRDGFHFDYKLGKSVGSLTISPLAITSPLLTGRRSPLPDGTVDVTAAIEVSEKWFPKEPGTIQISINNSVH
jgi:hypothetical protein